MAARRTSVVFLAKEPLTPSPPGPALRTAKLAEAAAAHCDVTLAAPRGSVFPDGPFGTRDSGPVDDPDIARAIAGHDVAVVPTLPSPRQLLAARRHAPHLVVDMVAPLALEAAEIGNDGAARAAITRWRIREQVAHLVLADLVLCTNDRQRDLALGMGLAGGALGRHPTRRSFAERVVVVPHGVDARPPRRGRRPLRASGAVSDGDRIVIWAGGLWSWFDPLTALRAVGRLRSRRPDLKLAFVGFEHPDAAQRTAHGPLTAEVHRFVRDQGLEDGVVLHPAWLEREDYFDHLYEADVAACLHRPTLEARFASRARIVDYVSAGLPVVCTGGDTMAGLVASRGLGAVIEPLDVDSCAAALDRLTREPPDIDGSTAIEAFGWERVARPLAEFCADPGPALAPRARDVLALAAREYPAFAAALYRSSRRDLGRAVARRATAGVRRRSG
jgi:glycosyltransferase involved in cell wall biosynthesis